MPPMLPSAAAASVETKRRCPCRTSTPANVRSVSSGTGSPKTPRNSSTKIAAGPYASIQCRSDAGTTTRPRAGPRPEWRMSNAKCRTARVSLSDELQVAHGAAGCADVVEPHLGVLARQQDAVRAAVERGLHRVVDVLRLRLLARG